MDESKIILSRLTDLAEKRDRQNCCVFSKFLTPAEQQKVCGFKDAALWGGFADAERKVAAFYPYYMEENEIFWELKAVKAVTGDGKTYSHRDYLGSLLGLGIKREVLGDILINENTAYIICLENMADYIARNFTAVAHSGVKTEIADIDEDILPPKKYEEITGSVSAPRLDSITAVAAGKSRSAAAELVNAGAVRVNFTENTSTSYVVKENDVLSVRGYGKFVYDGVSHISKKGRNIIKLRKYI